MVPVADQLAGLKRCKSSGSRTVSLRVESPDEAARFNLGNQALFAAFNGQQVIPYEPSITGWVANNRERVVLNGIVDDPRFAPLVPRHKIRSAVSVPILAAGKLVGVLSVNTLRPRPFTPGQIKALSVLANTAAAALENHAWSSALRESEGRFALALKSAPNILLNQDAGLRYTWLYNHLLSTGLKTLLESRMTIASQAATAQENGWLFLQTERRLRHLQALRAVDSAITASLDLRITFNVLLRQLTARLKVDADSILLLNQGALTFGNLLR